MCSHKAKEVALEKGFVETLIEEVKDRLVKLKIESAIGKSKENQVGNVNFLYLTWLSTIKTHFEGILL